MNSPTYRCSKRPKDFFSYAKKQIIDAKQACLGNPEAGQPPCPILIACRDYARRSGEWGTWGGETESERTAAGHPPRIKGHLELHGDALTEELPDEGAQTGATEPTESQEPKKLPKPRAPRKNLLPCGTPAAARRHRQAREPLCDPCSAAERADKEQQRRAKGMKPMQAAKCGTRPAYQGHLRRKEVPCQACKDADRAYRRGRPRPPRRSRNADPG